MRPKLTAPRPLIGKLAPLITQSPSHEEGRSAFKDRTQHWRKWYKAQRWRELRWRILTRDKFTCRMCGQIHYEASKLTCDHIRPHRGDPALFWDEANCQTLCTDPCHIKHKQSQEANWLQNG